MENSKITPGDDGGGQGKDADDLVIPPIGKVKLDRVIIYHPQDPEDDDDPEEGDDEPGDDGGGDPLGRKPAFAGFIKSGVAAAAAMGGIAAHLNTAPNSCHLQLRDRERYDRVRLIGQRTAGLYYGLLMSQVEAVKEMDLLKLQEIQDRAILAFLMDPTPASTASSELPKTEMFAVRQEEADPAELIDERQLSQFVAAVARKIDDDLFSRAIATLEKEVVSEAPVGLPGRRHQPVQKLEEARRREQLRQWRR